ncbi:stonustoxin subunit beta-like [Sander vitreus]
MALLHVHKDILDDLTFRVSWQSLSAELQSDQKEGKGMASGEQVQRDQIAEAPDSCELTLDMNTMNGELKLSDNNRKVTWVDEDQPYPDHPERFDRWCPQLLCRDVLTGRCYWEVEMRGDVRVAVSYRGINRSGDSEDCWFGCNDLSWSLFCSDGCYSVWHNHKRTDLPFSSSDSGRVGVYVDCPAGSLSFYSVSSDSLIHLHTFNTTFTEPLYPGFWVLVRWLLNVSVFSEGGDNFLSCGLNVGGGRDFTLSH